LPIETAEGWARAYLQATCLADKFAPLAWRTLALEANVTGGGPDIGETQALLFALREGGGPARPTELQAQTRKVKAKKGSQLQAPAARAELFHRFLHHELQAAELFAWAILRFPDAPADFKRGLLRIASDEIRHMSLYRGHLQALGYDFGAFPIRDWFWQRVPNVATAREFVATLGLGFEGANLDHAARFTADLLQAGDESGAALQALVGEEEVAHVRFAYQWFLTFSEAPALAFDAWTGALPKPLSPVLMRGLPLAREPRQKAGFPTEFLDSLEAFAFVP
jgi:uncharacterized ferritin-like protein (DUF455 family)